MLSTQKAILKKEKNASSISETSIRLRLPMPPSVNKSYANVPGIGRVKTKVLKEWEQSARRYMLAQKKYEIFGDQWLDVHYTFHGKLFTNTKSIRKWDAFNYEKVLSDFLVKVIPGFKDENILDGHTSKRD